ncbi:MAG: hypothetical protein Q8P67_02145, partial [archaeon]|nr:hypothetical protein [archaeon]
QQSPILAFKSITFESKPKPKPKPEPELHNEHHSIRPNAQECSVPDSDTDLYARMRSVGEIESFQYHNNGAK